MTDAERLFSRGRRPLRSYVIRKGRLTKGQQCALEELWPEYGIELPPSGEHADFQSTFQANLPIRLEIGFGDGDALLQMAKQNPQYNFIGIEVYRPGIGRLLLQIEAQQLKNIRLFCADAIEVLQAIEANTIDAIYLYFPDPWQKKKHHKRRIVQTAFVGLIADRLMAGGHFYFATDWQPYAEHALEVLEQSPRLKNGAGTAQFSPHQPDRPLTKFERRGYRLGHLVWDIVMRKSNEHLVEN